MSPTEPRIQQDVIAAVRKALDGALDILDTSIDVLLQADLNEEAQALASTAGTLACDRANLRDKARELRELVSLAELRATTARIESAIVSTDGQ